MSHHLEHFPELGLTRSQGMFGDKPATIDRFKEVYRTQLNDEIRARLVLENDEMCYNPDDLLPVCEELEIPLVVSPQAYIHRQLLTAPLQFDYHHNWIYVRDSSIIIVFVWKLTQSPVRQPSELPLPVLIARANAIWHRKGIKPKQHLSEPCPGAESVMEKRKHSDRCQSLPEHLPDDMDLMIEVCTVASLSTRSHH